MITHKLTKDGYQERVLELDQLKKNRPHALQEMVQMRELGDLSENAGYRASRRKLMQLDRRIQYLEHLLSSVEVIGFNSQTQVAVGNKVSVRNESNEIKAYVVVEPHEADIVKLKISSRSPLGRSLLHRRIDETVEVITQNGKKQYRIVGIS